MNKHGPKVSVILPSLNVAEYIEECMDSVVCQTLKELEIICVDAGSTDGTREILDRYAREDSRITILHSARRSYGYQINMGLNYASGKYTAVLETDDWIEQDMYQCLYECAEVRELDYAAADFDMFWQLQSGECYFVRQYLFRKEGQDWYGKVLNSDQLATLRASDYVLWKGIYNRKFLDDNQIRFHESPGAAFQDMGFLQQVKTYARKAIYLDRSFYRYRQSRQNASSGALEGLGYYENEFRWINEDLKLPCILKGFHKKYYYFTMSISLITKYEQILESLNGDWQDERLQVPYEWFRIQVLDAMECKFLEESMYGEEQWKCLNLLIESQELHAQYIQDKEEKSKCQVREFINTINNRSIVIFGCGIWGIRLMNFCDRSQMHILAFCDNNPSLHGERKFGFPIISPDELKKKVNDKNQAVILAMKNGREEVFEQLIEMGIEASAIIDCIPEKILK